jgi:mannose-6-phosphate isomerase-like protein (cupin superfamily)
VKKMLLLLSLLVSQGLGAQDREVDPTWLHRYVPQLAETKGDLTSETCHYRAIFGEGDKENRILQSVARFGEVTLDANGNCHTVLYDRQEEIYFVVEGGGVLHYQDQTQALRKHDFTYLPPGVKHSISNHSGQPLRVLVMGFKIQSSISITAPMPHPRVANLEEAKEETVSGHPSSVLYKLLAGLRTGKRDLMFEGQGEMVAGSGMDGVEGRYRAKMGDAYYFRPNCTVGFYNQDKPAEKAYILAVRSRIPPREDQE